MRPLTLAPRRDIPQVVSEVHSVELVMDEFPDVPREIVVTGKKGNEFSM